MSKTKTGKAATEKPKVNKAELEEAIADKQAVIKSKKIVTK